MLMHNFTFTVNLQLLHMKQSAIQEAMDVYAFQNTTATLSVIFTLVPTFDTAKAP